MGPGARFKLLAPRWRAQCLVLQEEAVVVVAAVAAAAEAAEAAAAEAEAAGHPTAGPARRASSGS